jgi:NitT/TauT family transport system permease protein
LLKEIRGETIWASMLGGNILYHFVVTLRKLIAGFLLGLILGVALGFMTSEHKYRDYINLPVMSIMAIPTIVVLLVCLSILGANDLAVILAEAIITCPYGIINTWSGLDSVDKNLIDMARSFGASRTIIVKDILVPHLVPYWLSAARSILALAWKVCVLGELFCPSGGLGFAVRLFYALDEPSMMIAWLSLFIVAVVVLELILRLARKWSMAWTYS